MRNVYRARARALAVREELDASTKVALTKMAITSAMIFRNGIRRLGLLCRDRWSNDKKAENYSRRSRIWLQTGGNKNVTHSQTWRAVAPEPAAGSAGLAGGALLPQAFTLPAFAVGDHPAIGTFPAGSQGDTVNIGAAVPRTGTYAVQGEDELKGWQLAVEHINNGDPLLKKIAPKV